MLYRRIKRRIIRDFRLLSMQMADKFLNRSNQWNENKWPEIWDTLSTLPGSRAEISQKITSEHKSEMANRILELKKRELTILNKNKLLNHEAVEEKNTATIAKHKQINPTWN